MSEIKLTKDSIQNAILTDSKLVGGYVNGDGYISAIGNGAVAIGYASNGGTIEASGNGAHAEGYNTRAWADGAHAGGIETIANREAMTAIGKYNYINWDSNYLGYLDGDVLFEVGNGTGGYDSSRSNAFVVTTEGITASLLNLSGGSYQGEHGGKISWSNDNCWIQEIEESKLTVHSDGDLYLLSNSGIYANASVYISNNGLEASRLNVSTATISTINGSPVPNYPKFTDTVYEHPGVTATLSTSSVSPAHNATFSVIDDISIDSSGHVTKINTKTVKLPTGGSIDTDTKQTVTASNEKVFLTGVKSTSTTSEGFANANVYMLNGGLVASGLSVTTATISTLNGSTVPNNPKFTDTVYTHPDKTLSNSTSSASPGHGGSFTVVDSVTRDGLGHVSGINVKTVTLPGSGNTDTKQTVTASNEKVFLTGVKSTSTTSEGFANANVYMLNGGLVASGLSVTTATISTINGKTVGNDPKFTDTVYTHPTISATSNTSTATLGHSGTFTVVESVTTNTNGHVTKIGTKTFTLPPSGNTDEKVKVNASTTNGIFPLMAVNSTGPTNGGTYGAIYNTGIVINPSIHSVAEGGSTSASGLYSHAKGYKTMALGTASYAEGIGATIQLGRVVSTIDDYSFDLKDTEKTKLLQDGDIVKCGSNYAKVTDTKLVHGIEIKYLRITTDVAIGANPDDNIYLIKGGISYEECAHSEGNSTIASGYASHAEGEETNASGYASHAEGCLTTASGEYSHAGGYYTIANVNQVTVIGRYNSSCNEGDLFIIGNGNITDTRKTVFKVSDSAGNGTGGNDAIVNVTGQVNATGGFYDESDIRKKEVLSNISLEKSYELLDKCQEIIYVLKEDPNKKELVGMIAQEVEEFFPEIVSTDNDGFKSLDYARLSVICLKLIKDIVELIKEIKNEIKNINGYI